MPSLFAKNVAYEKIIIFILDSYFLVYYEFQVGLYFGSYIKHDQNAQVMHKHIVSLKSILIIY